MDKILTKLRLLEIELDNYIEANSDQIALSSIKSQITQIREEIESINEVDDQERALELLIKLVELLNAFWLNNM